MAKLLQGILGGISGSVANVVGSSWKGIPVIKSKPLSVANPKTAGQVAQRGKFANVVNFAQLILASVIKPLWDRFQTGMSGYNAFVSANIDLFASELPSPAASLTIADGKMAATSMLNANLTNGSALVDIEWTDDSGTGFKLATDKAYAVCINETQGTVGYVAAANTRDAEGTQITMPAAIVTGDTVHAYLAFLRADGTVVSQTAYKAGSF